MLRVEGVVAKDLPCVIECDPYVPLLFKAYTDLLPGARDYRIGDFERSFLEIRIDPSCRLLRGVCLLVFGRVLSSQGPIAWSARRESTGLPLIDLSSVPDEYVDEHVDFSVGLFGDSFVIDWSTTEGCDELIRHGNVSFYVAGGELRGVTFSNLRADQTAILSEHLRRARP
ncbi:MAG: hypothetical protein NUV77_24960 [Thermoguttaceae bacterium]|jgi:hypothetical protein|nr:hypothetical protein [Thermoguttaceae bacterium]